MTGRVSQGWLLSIDFGTTATAGAMRDNGDGELVEIDNERRMPSMVCWKEKSNGTPGRLLVGDEAENEAAFAPHCLERCPKRKLGQEFILLGSERMRVTDAIGQIFRHVVEEATARQGGRRPRELRLTHPARWGERRLNKLREAAAFAGFDEPLLLPEPVGAAVYFAEKELKPGDHVVVYDLGGGTFDTALLERTTDGFRVIGKPGGREDLGGEDFDDLLYRYLGQQVDQEQWQMLVSPDSDTMWLRAHYDFKTDVRRAKERLSRWPDAKVRTPIPGTPDLEVSAAEFEDLIGGKIDLTISELERTVTTAGKSLEELSAIYLAGGSSQIPLVARRIEETLGTRPRMLGDPKGVIALGATRAQIGQIRTPDTSSPPRTPAAQDTDAKRRLGVGAAERAAPGELATAARAATEAGTAGAGAAARA
jgi:molecular chaperone DnaK (HSP70)